MRYVHDDKQKNYFRSKETDGLRYFSGNGEKYCSAVVITIIFFLCFDVKVYFSTYETTVTITFFKVKNGSDNDNIS